MNKYVLITAGGIGTRMNNAFPKQFIPIAGKPLLMHTINVFHDYDPLMKIILVLPEEHIPLWKDLCSEFDFQMEHQIVRGGTERFHSVQNGLKHVPSDSVVLIHDGVRPLVRPDTIDRVIQKTIEKGNAVPCIIPTNSIRKIGDNNTNEAIDRNQIRLIQTPQGFLGGIIKAAYTQVYREDFTDDASVVESNLETINLVEGNFSNIKVTHPADLKIVEALMTVI